MTHSVVLRLLEGLEGRGHHVYMDNFYSSPSLYKDLKDKGIGACGIVRLNRKGMPNEWTCKNSKVDTLKIGDVRKNVLGKKYKLTALQWRDKRVITMISTIHDGDEMISKRRRTRIAEGGREDVMKPVMIDRYNTFMGGVDKSDHSFLIMA